MVPSGDYHEPRNAVLAYTILDAIKLFPENWDQLWYFTETESCGTAACVAGWASILSGDMPGNRGKFHVETTLATRSDGEIVDVWNRGRELLGLTMNEAMKLFDGGNSLTRIKSDILRLFGPRPFINEVDDSLSTVREIVYAPCQPIGCDNEQHLEGCVYAMKADPQVEMVNGIINEDDLHTRPHGADQ